MIRRLIGVWMGLLALCVLASAQTPQEDLVKQIGIDQRLGADLPKDAFFLKEDGTRVRFVDLLTERPSILVPIFYSCQTACAVVSENLMKTLTKATRGNRLRVGRDMNVIFLSIKPTETPDLALRKRNVYVDAYNQPGSEKGWVFLTGDEENIRKVTNAVGFRYTWDPDSQRINHPAGVMILTPKAQVSSYVLGTQYPTKILQDNIERAAKNQIGPVAETFLFGCLMLDPATGQKRIVIENVVRLAGVVTLFVLIGSIIKMSLADRKKTPTLEAKNGR